MNIPLDPPKEAIDSLVKQIVDFVPNLLAATLLLVFGWLVARLIAAATRTLAQRLRLDEAMERAGWQEDLEQAGVRLAPSEILGRLVYWIVFLVFLALALENLGIDLNAVPLQAFLKYLPRVFGAVLLIFVGAVLAGIVSQGFSAALARLDFAQHKALAGFVHGLILLVTFLAVFDQLGFDVSLLSKTLANLLAIFAAALAITFALGGRDIAKNMLAGYYARERFHAGDKLQMEEASGELIGIGTVNSVLETAEGQLVIPNQRLVESSVVKLAPES